MNLPDSSCPLVQVLAFLHIQLRNFSLCLQVQMTVLSLSPCIFTSLPLNRHPSLGLAYLVVQIVKNPPAMQETWVRSLDWEEPLEKEMATHCSILAWEIPWTEEPGGLQSMGS